MVAEILPKTYRHGCGWDLDWVTPGTVAVHGAREERNIIQRTPASMVALALLTTTLLGLGATPANATSAEDTLFDSAQLAVGLDPVDAQALDQGVSVKVQNDEAVAGFGDFEVGIAPSADVFSTTVLPAGIRVMSRIDDGAESTDFRVDLPEGATLIPRDRGYVVVIGAGGTPIALAEIEEPWAVDANGKTVHTSYRLDGDILTQSLHGSDIAYPVVADPTITVGLAGASEGPGAYWNMTGLQVKIISAITVSTLGTALAGGCVGAGKMPSVGWIIQGLCSFVGVPTLQNIWGGVTSIFRNTSVQNTGCYQVKIAPVGMRLHKVDRSNCA
ncbi:hypothetical protein [Clavibacter nebraskensis]